MGMVIRTYTSHAFGTYGSSPWLLRPPAPSPLARGQFDTRIVNAREEVENAALRLLLHVEERPSEHMEEWRTASPHGLCAHRVRHGLICDGSNTICQCFVSRERLQGSCFWSELKMKRCVFCDSWGSRAAIKETVEGTGAHGCSKFECTGLHVDFDKKHHIHQIL